MAEVEQRDLPRSQELPAARILSNGRYTACLTASGTGFSRLGSDALTDRHGERWDQRGGLQLLLRDRERRRIWPAGIGEGGPENDYMGTWTAGSARLSGRQEDWGTELEVCVHPELDCELRRIRITNHGDRPRRLEVTAYLEPVVLPAEAHEAHPAFSKLFLQTEWNEAARALVVRRRRRDPEDDPPPLVLAMPGPAPVVCESDRSRLLPRAASVEEARVAPALAVLTGRTGSVLDPALCLRRELALAGGEGAEVLVVLGAARDEGALRALLEQAAAPGGFDSMLEGARTSQLHILAELGLSGEEAAYLELLAAGLLLNHPALWLPPAAAVRPATRSELQAHLGLGPDRLFVLADERRLAARDLALLRQGQLYWQALALPLDLVIVEDGVGEAEERRGSDGFRRLKRDRCSEADLLALAAAARFSPADRLPPLIPVRHRRPAWQPPAPAAAGAAEEQAGPRFFNGYGGFSDDGREYVIRLAHRDGRLRLPPRPWINVIANETFGFLVSETGAGATWRGNSREHRLTPWFNDPILDPHGEAFYLRDEDTGGFWSPLPGPAPAPADYEMRHGLGYSRCRVVHEDLAQETLLFAAKADPVRIAHIRIHNRGRRRRRLTLWAHYQLCLGSRIGEGRRHVVIAAGDVPGDLRATRRGVESPIAFAAARTEDAGSHATGSGDRAAFLGNAMDVSAPAALETGRLAERAGADLDACFTQRLAIALEPGAAAEACFLLGEADSEAGVADICRRHGNPDAWRGAFDAVRDAWVGLCDRLQVSTPAPELDIMVNAWLPYQTLGCRILGRSALYQSGGAFGFRDQLQDAGAMLLHDPRLSRRQILLHAAHQFAAGDVMHWWHPRTDVGLRTRFADDLLWLPLATAEYVAATGDDALLAESVDFLRARPLAPGEDEALLPIARAGRPASLYAHCCRAIDRSLVTGARGLPLFGGGDWNDGMNRVGREGRGESVWMGFFLVAVIDAFLPSVAAQGDEERRRRYQRHRDALVAALEEAGWDGDWYRRGYYDDGTPLGSRESDECRIDVLAQAWSVISGAAAPERAARAVAAAEEHLISEREGLIRLLTPPFDTGAQDPGYIKGYVPGVRENGGQYTHAALWLVRALAGLGRRDRVARLLALINPINHGATPEAADRYQVEPYVVAADIYGVPPHVGRGGWTWYTGAAGWLLRVAVESLLGLQVAGGRTLCLTPCVPDEWPAFEIRYRPAADAGGTLYRIQVANPHRCAEAVVACLVDGQPLATAPGQCRVPLVRDRREHVVTITLGPRPEGAR
ncbi:MAG: glycosyl transferase [Candidatus Krumholzibacteriota bacterium]|nr:glycosyl transferase [Candidatus Krumholzibacteriota bacterium]